VSTDFVIELREVTADNWRDCAAVRPRDEQAAFVAPITCYLCLCHYGRIWHPLAVYHEDDVVGFVMWGLDEADGSHWIGGLVIDAAHQGRGLGRATVTALLDRLVRHRERARGRALLSSRQSGSAAIVRAARVPRERRG